MNSDFILCKRHVANIQLSVQVQKIDVSVTNPKHDLLDKHVQIQFIVGRTNQKFNTLNKG